MAYIQWKIDRYAFNGLSWSGTPNSITTFYDPILSVALGDKKDTFAFKLDNPYGQWDNYFKPNDKIVISRIKNATSFSSSDIIMAGVIRDSPTNASGTQDELRIEGYNYSESVTTGIVFINPTNKSPMEIIEEAVDNLRLMNTNFSVTYDTTNPTTKKNGSPFPTYSPKYFYKPLSKVLDEQLSSGNTQDGRYRWYVTTDNKLKIIADTDGNSYSYDASTDSDTVNYRDGRDLNNVKNFVIIKGGSDPSGLPIQTRYQDYTSISRHGVKFHFMVDNNKYAESLNKQDMTDSWGSNATSRFPQAYPFTTTWRASYTETVEGVSVVSGNYTLVNNDDEYNAVLKQEAITRLKSDAQAYVEEYRFGKLKIDITVNAGSKSWALGDLIICTVPRLGITNKTLKVMEIQYTTEIDTFSLEETTGTL